MTTYAFPGYVGDVATTARVESTWQKAIRDRANQVFDTYAHLVAGVTSPKVGQEGIVTADGLLSGVYVYSGATVGWTKPWNLGWGPVAAPTLSTSDSAATTVGNTADLPGATATWTTVANRRYRYTLSTGLKNSLATGVATIFMTDAANAAKGFQSNAPVFMPVVSATPSGVTLTAFEDIAAAGSTTRKGRFTSLVGTTTAVGTAFTVHSLTVEDVGPSGAPS